MGWNRRGGGWGKVGRELGGGRWRANSSSSDFLDFIEGGSFGQLIQNTTSDLGKTRFLSNQRRLWVFQRVVRRRDLTTQVKTVRRNVIPIELNLFALVDFRVRFGTSTLLPYRLISSFSPSLEKTQCQQLSRSQPTIRKSISFSASRLHNTSPPPF